MKRELREQIFTIVARIPCGRITTYGRIAAMTDGATPRMVGTALRSLDGAAELPWHRVVSATRRLADHPGAREQYRRLVDEGVAFDGRGRIAAERLWP